MTPGGDPIPAIRVQGVHKHFGSLHALRGVDLAIEQGEFFALLGPNGAGKTTLISILAGLARADEGRVEILGFDVRHDYRRARRALGVVPQELVFDPFFTVREFLTIQSGYYGLRRNEAWIEELLHHLDLTPKADTNMRNLSGGMKRRALVAQALVHKPPVIVLDEPTSGVDVELRHSLWQFIQGLNREGHTIVLTTHYLEEAQNLCTRVAMLKHGGVVALDATESLLQATQEPSLRLALVPDRLPPSLAPRLTLQEKGVYTLSLRDYGETEEVLRVLREAGVRVADMSVERPDLEDVFVQIMSRH